MSKILSIAVLFLMFVASTGCNRTDRNSDETAGKGGNAVIRITPTHHGKNIDSATIYIKYNAQDLPTSYDDSAVCVNVDGKPVATFSQLKKGKYYLAGKGWDPTILNEVNGGIPYSIVEEQTFSIELPVTESH